MRELRLLDWQYGDQKLIPHLQLLKLYIFFSLKEYYLPTNYNFDCNGASKTIAGFVLILEKWENLENWEGLF